MTFRVSMLKKYIELLYQSRNRSPQEQLALVHDIGRRGFLKQIMQLTLFATLSTTCCGVPAEYNAILPEIGDSDRSGLSPREADFLGRQVIQDIQNKGSMLDDYDILAYLNEVGGDLVSYSSEAGQNFNFYLVRDTIINAFALPGGYICLYNGLIFTTRTEAELTSVMAHEIGHVVQHHIFRNIAGYNRNQWLALAGVLSAAMMATVNPSAAMLAIHGSQGLATQNMLSNSRDFEREADRVGQKIMYSAGYDPHAMPEFFKRLKDENKFNDNEAFAFLRTHPVTSERISEAETRANQLDVGQTRPDSISFLLIREKCRVRQFGVVEAIKFYQGTLKFKKYSNIDAQYYGLAFAQFLAKNLPAAWANLSKIAAPSFTAHPAVISLKALVQKENKNYMLAEKLYRAGLDLYPAYKGLWLGQSDLYIKSKQYELAVRKLDELSQNYPLDVDVWVHSAVLYSDAALNNRQKYHYALGNKLYLLGDYKEALSQYQRALTIKNADPVLNDVISAKVLETRSAIQNSLQYGDG